MSWVEPYKNLIELICNKHTNVKMHEKYEWLSLYILMIKNWDSTKKVPTNLMIEEWDLTKKKSTNNCEQIMRYSAERFLLQHTDQTQTKNNWS